MGRGHKALGGPWYKPALTFIGGGLYIVPRRFYSPPPLLATKKASVTWVGPGPGLPRPGPARSVRAPVLQVDQLKEKLQGVVLQTLRARICKVLCTESSQSSRGALTVRSGCSTMSMRERTGSGGGKALSKPLEQPKQVDGDVSPFTYSKLLNPNADWDRVS